MAAVMQYYPAFLNLSGTKCLVVGAGPVGLRKAQSLAACGPAEVLVVDPAPPSADWLDLPDTGPIVYAERPFEDADLDGRLLVFAATGSAEVNQGVVALCRERGILCNRAETPEDTDFLVPAHFSLGDMVVAVSTGGGSPALARMIRQDLENWFGEHYGDMVRLMATLRPMVLELGLGQQANADLFRSLTRSMLLDALKEHDLSLADLILRRLLPEALHARIPEVLDGI